MRKYEPLEFYLSSHVDDSCELTHECIERIISAKLPLSASTDRQWWENQTSGKRSQAESWMHAGWHVVNEDPHKGRVQFARHTPTSPVDRLAACLTATQLLVFLSMPGPAREPLLERLIEVATELAGRQPNRFLKQTVREAQAMRALLDEVESRN